MPKRVIDFDAMWGSDKLASCAAWAQAEYAWLYGLADASGCFEMTNLRVIWGRVAAIRHNLTIERLEQIFAEFQDKGLLFAWEHEGKRYGHWTGSDVPGRLPPPSWRMRLEKLAPPVPKQQMAEYMSKFARGRATLPGGGFFAESSQGAGKAFAQNGEDKASLERGLDKGLKGGLEEDQAQDWNWDRNKKGKKEGKEHGSHDDLAADEARPELHRTLSHDLSSNSETAQSTLHAAATALANSKEPRPMVRNRSPQEPVLHNGASAYQARDRSGYVLRELAVGQGPSMGPVRVTQEALDRIRARDAARKEARSP